MIDSSAPNTTQQEWYSKVLRGYYSREKVAANITDAPILKLIAGVERSGEILDAITNALRVRTNKEFAKIRCKNPLVEALGLFINSSTDHQSPFSYYPVFSKEEFKKTLHQELNDYNRFTVTGFSYDPIAIDEVSQAHIVDTSESGKISLRLFSQMEISKQSQFCSDLGSCTKLLGSLYRYQNVEDLLKSFRDSLMNSYSHSYQSQSLENLAQIFSGDDKVIVPKRITLYNSSTVNAVQYLANHSPEHLRYQGGEQIRIQAAHNLLYFFTKTINKGQLLYWAGMHTIGFSQAGQVVVGHPSAALATNDQFSSRLKTMFSALLERDHSKLKKLIIRYGLISIPEKVNIDLFIQEVALKILHPFITDEEFLFDRRYYQEILTTFAGYREKYKWSPAAEWVGLLLYFLGFVRHLCALEVKVNPYRLLTPRLLH